MIKDEMIEDKAEVVEYDAETNDAFRETEEEKPLADAVPAAAEEAAKTAKNTRKKSDWGKSVSRKFLVIALAGTVLLNAVLTAGMMAFFSKNQAKSRNNASRSGRFGNERFYGGNPENNDRMMPPDGGQGGGMMPPGSRGDTNGFGSRNGNGNSSDNASGNPGDSQAQQPSKASIGIVIREDSGVYVAQVNGENAKKAGFKEGDKIVSFDGNKISTGNDLIAAVQNHKSGDSVAVVLERDGKEVKIETELEWEPEKKL